MRAWLKRSSLRSKLNSLSFYFEAVCIRPLNIFVIGSKVYQNGPGPPTKRNWLVRESTTNNRSGQAQNLFMASLDMSSTSTWVFTSYFWRRMLANSTRSCRVFGARKQTPSSWLSSRSQPSLAWASAKYTITKFTCDPNCLLRACQVPRSRRNGGHVILPKLRRVSWLGSLLIKVFRFTKLVLLMS